MKDVNILKISNYEKIGSLNLLKFSLAFLTFLFHWNMHFSVVYSNRLVNNFVRTGAVAMSGFIILSGFLLYYVYFKKDFFNNDFLKTFYKKRIIKILPSMYLIVIIMYFLRTFIGNETINWVEILIQFLGLQAYFPHLFGSFLNGGLWFVSVLLFLYILFPLFCFILKSIKKIYCFAIVVYIFGIFPLIVDCYRADWSLYFLPYFRICEFIMGMISARLFLNSEKNSKFAALYSILIILLIFFGVSLLYKNKFFYHVTFDTHYMYYDVILLILFPMLIYFLAKSKMKYFLLITDNKLSEYLGNIAYSFFLTQIICYFVIKNYFMPNNYFGMNSSKMLVFSLILNIIFSIILYELFEKRISKLLINYYIKGKK